jgi:hypothetical protein
MIPDLSKMEEVRCPDCHTPVAFSQVGGPSSTSFELQGCRCNRAVYDLPDGGGLFGISGGLFTLLVPKSEMIQ